MERGSLIVCEKKQKKFTDRELEILNLVVLGKSNTEIAEELTISVHTAKAHVCSILHKLSVDNRVQAAVKAIRDCLFYFLISLDWDLCSDIFPCFSSAIC